VLGSRSLRRAVGTLVAAALSAIASCSPDAEPPAPEATAAAATASAAPVFVGREVCAGCHPAEEARWRGSHHDLSMQPATEQTVLGDFGGAAFTAFGVTTTFFRRDGRFLVRTEGTDGALHDYEVAYTFGVDPLQQVLVPFPDGRLQALTIAWDARPAAEGGQRWYSLYPDERIPPGDRLHWTGIDQNWNHMCAECHSTNLVKGYREAQDRFETRWSELDVSCEACHGPGSAHVDWARAAGAGATGSGAAAGLAVDLGADGASWVFDPGAAIAHRGAPRRSRAEIETCARCHSRRSPLGEIYSYGRPLLDTHRLALLESDLYYADGQMLGEVYVHGSFLQSRMYAAGVTCSDCHDPHSLALRAEGNALCGGCHRPDHFDAPAHHHHEPGSPGAQCVACHMPTRTYMGIDARREHAFRIPRPGLASRIGAPDACTACHADRSAAWAAETVAAWRGEPEAPHFGDAIEAGRTGAAGAGEALAALALDPAQPGIARATAFELLSGYPSARTAEAVARGIEDADPLVRLGAVEASTSLEPGVRLARVQGRLRDPVRAVRIAAARVLVGVPPELWRSADRTALADALKEYREAELLNADRPEGHLNLGTLDVRLGELEPAREEYEAALRIDPSFVPATVNLVDLLRIEGRDDEGERRLRDALAVAPDQPVLNHVLGLTLVREGRLAEALEPLGRAAAGAPGEARYSYVYAVALEAAGAGERALAVLHEASARQPGRAELLIALADLERQQGDLDAAAASAERALSVVPDDPAALDLLTQIEAARSAPAREEAGPGPPGP
jgi:predicted CXXCH cytochrome family protein